MNVDYFISKRLFTTKEKNNNHTRPILRIVIFAIALSLTIMILFLSVVKGFKENISDKIIGFNSHISLMSYGSYESYEKEPINKNPELLTNLSSDNNIKHIQSFATKAGILKNDQEILGVVLKGVDTDFNWNFIENYLTKGTVFKVIDSVSINQIVISKNIANKLNLDVNDHVLMYFVQDPPVIRKFLVTGIYDTDFSDFDNLMIYSDIKIIQKLNRWNKNQIGGYEIQINDLDLLDKTTKKVYDEIDYNLDARNIKETNAQMFDWLNLQDMNTLVVLILLFTVALVNIIIALLILVLQRTKMIGILKALGCRNWIIRKIFLFNTLYLCAKGLFWGNVIGLSLAFLQKQFKIIGLNPDAYYMSTVPISIDFVNIVLLNLSILFLCWISLLIPSIIIARINPIRSINYS